MHRFARRVWCRFAQRLGQLLVAVAHLHPGDDRFPLLRCQPPQRLFVAFNCLTTDRLFERRFGALDFEVIKIGRLRLPSFSPQLISDAIEHCLTQVRLQRTDMARLELFDPLERLNQGVLDKIIRVGEIARPLREPTPGPSLERFDVSREEAYERLLIARTGPLDQVKG